MSMLHSNPYYYTYYTISQNQNTTSRDVQFPVCLVRALTTHMQIWSTVQLRCNFTLTCEQFTHTHMELLMVCALLPARNSHKIIRWSSGVVSDTVTNVSLRYHVIDHNNVHRLVLGLVSHSQNLSQGINSLGAYTFKWKGNLWWRETSLECIMPQTDADYQE